MVEHHLRVINGKKEMNNEDLFEATHKIVEDIIKNKEKYNRDEETIITDDKYLYLDLVSPFHNQRYEKMLVREDKDLKSKINQYFNKLLEDNIKYSMFDAKGPGFNI
jgi:hypothetical protein